ncbi:dynein light chain roadblock-type 2 isoform X1 [Heliangelus exortis]|uniref:dynein light chain roadblock-type 2 isoform X1 n=1 Tax=Heliangelus exortis TaxID=472823 RepID=UPI003A8E554B
MAEVEETLKRIQAHRGVFATIVTNAEGIPIRTTLDNSTTVQYAALLQQLTKKARSTVRDIDPQNDLTFLRIRSKKYEIMVAPGLSVGNGSNKSDVSNSPSGKPLISTLI